MTTYVDFKPSANTPFQFNVTLDGNSYVVIITWNIFGQRWYVNLYTLQGTRIFTLPMISSPDEYDISLTAGYFNSIMVYRASDQRFEINP